MFQFITDTLKFYFAEAGSNPYVKKWHLKQMDKQVEEQKDDGRSRLL